VLVLYFLGQQTTQTLHHSSKAQLQREDQDPIVTCCVSETGWSRPNEQRYRARLHMHRSTDEIYRVLTMAGSLVSVCQWVALCGETLRRGSRLSPAAPTDGIRFPTELLWIPPRAAKYFAQQNHPTRADVAQLAPSQKIQAYLIWLTVTSNGHESGQSSHQALSLHGKLPTTGVLHGPKGRSIAIADSLPDIYAISTLTYHLQSCSGANRFLWSSRAICSGLAQMWMVDSQLPTLSPSRAPGLKDRSPQIREARL
jgi:hypothetical protein